MNFSILSVLYEPSFYNMSVPGMLQRGFRHDIQTRM